MDGCYHGLMRLLHNILFFSRSNTFNEEFARFCPPQHAHYTFLPRSQSDVIRILSSHAARGLSTITTFPSAHSSRISLRTVSTLFDLFIISFSNLQQVPVRWGVTTPFKGGLSIFPKQATHSSHEDHNDINSLYAAPSRPPSRKSRYVPTSSSYLDQRKTFWSILARVTKVLSSMRRARFMRSLGLIYPFLDHSILSSRTIR